MKSTFFLLVLALGMVFPLTLSAQLLDSLEAFETPVARQAVAVDKKYLYAISNSMIEKLDKTTGKTVKKWKDISGDIKHLNSGVVIKNKLYCANSNFPGVPMASSIEIFDTKTLRPVESYSLGIYIGSATWIDRYDGHWYIAFAHYDNHGDEEDKDNKWTQLVQFDDHWRREQAWILPEEINNKFSPMSNSGGFISSNGTLFLTGHDNKALYLLTFPRSGYTLKWENTIPAPFEGQGIAVDPEDPTIIYGIIRSRKEVVKVKLNRDRN